jgi:hypothetical protein
MPHELRQKRATPPSVLTGIGAGYCKHSERAAVSSAAESKTIPARDAADKRE